MADDSIKTIDDIMTQAEIEKFDAQWRADVKRQFISAEQREWFRMRPPARDVLLEYPGQKNANGEYLDEPQDMLAQGIVGMLAATGGVGKTQALVQLALAVAGGTSWLGKFEVCNPGHVAIMLAEESQEEAWRRFYYATRNLGLIERIPMLEKRIWPLTMHGTSCRFVNPQTGELSRTFVDFREALLETDVDWRLIILDPASRLMPMDAELDNLAATEFVALLESLTTLGRSKPTVLVAHHTRKQGTGKLGVRGASALTDGVRWLATMSSYGVAQGGGVDPEGYGRVLFEVHKSNYGPRKVNARMGFDEHGILRELTADQLAAESEPASKRSNGKTSSGSTRLTAQAFDLD